MVIDPSLLLLGKIVLGLVLLWIGLSLIRALLIVGIGFKYITGQYKNK